MERESPEEVILLALCNKMRLVSGVYAFAKAQPAAVKLGNASTSVKGSLAAVKLNEPSAIAIAQPAACQCR